MNSPRNIRFSFKKRKAFKKTINNFAKGNKELAKEYFKTELCEVTTIHT